MYVKCWKHYLFYIVLLTFYCIEFLDKLDDPFNAFHTPDPKKSGYTVLPLCVCLSVRPSFLSVSATTNRRCLKFYDTLCLGITYVWWDVFLSVNWRFLIILAYIFKEIFVRDYSAAVYCICLKFHHTLCLDMPYVGNYFCSNQTSTFC